MQRKQLQIQSLDAGFYWEPLLFNKKNTTKGHIEEVMAIKLRKPTGLDLPAIYNPLATFLLHNLTLHNADEVQAIWTKINIHFLSQILLWLLFFFFRNPQAASVYQVVLRGQMV